MDDKGNGSRFVPKVCGPNNQQDYYSSLRPKVFDVNAMYTRGSSQDPGDEEEELGDDELGEEQGETNGFKMIGKEDSDDDEEDTDDDVDEEEDDEDNGDHADGKRYNGKVEDIGNGKPQKKRKLRTLISNYEFAPRVPTPFVPKPVVSQPTSGGQSSVGDWTEKETFALLDAWGERFVRLGRKSLRSEEWQEVADKVSQETNIRRTDAQCRNRLDTLKKKYKKEKTRLTAEGSGNSSGWVFYRKLDMLLSSPPQQQIGLSCGIDSGQYVFMNPNVYLNRANGLDEMRDSPGNSESPRKEDDSDGLPPKGKRNRGRRVGGSSLRMLADSMQKFSDVYEKIESNKRKQMVELENMRMDFRRQLETQRRQFLERAQAEIAKIRQGGDDDDDDENDLSAENASG